MFVFLPVAAARRTATCPSMAAVALSLPAVASGGAHHSGERFGCLRGLLVASPGVSTTAVAQRKAGTALRAMRSSSANGALPRGLPLPAVDARAAAAVRVPRRDKRAAGAAQRLGICGAGAGLDADQMDRRGQGCDPALRYGRGGFAARLSAADDSTDRGDLIMSEACPRAVLIAAVATGFGEGMLLQGCASAHPACPVPLLAGLAASPDPGVRTNVAEHPRCPPAVLATLAADEHPNVWLRAARHPRCPPGAAARLASHPDWARRYEYARDADDAHPVVLDALAEDASDTLREAVAANDACTAETLTRMASDRSSFVRYLIADHRNCPAGVLTRLAWDCDAAVRRVALTRMRPAQRLDHRLRQVRAWWLRIRAASRPGPDV